MDIEIAGICYPDPLGRKNLIRWLRSVFSARGTDPTFIAVEWDQGVFEQVRSQRPLLTTLIRQEWPDADGQFVGALVDAMGFEGDAHTEVFPGTATLWLDQGRKVDDLTKISQFAQDRLVNYRSMYARSSEGDSTLRLQRMSQVAWDSVDCNNPASVRDNEFGAAIRKETAPAESGWAIAVVGVCHARQGLGFLRDLLDEAGFGCNTTEIREDDQERTLAG